MEQCPVCGGEGYVGGLVIGDDIVDEVCRTCRGHGAVPSICRGSEKVPLGADLFHMNGACPECKQRFRIKGTNWPIQSFRDTVLIEHRGSA